MCSKPNPEDLDACQFCGARLKPLTAPLDPIHPGETPLKKDTSDLERTLPGWLRDIRSASSDAEPPQADKLEADEVLAPTDLPDFLKDESAPASVQPEMDFLAGLANAGFDDSQPLSGDSFEGGLADTSAGVDQIPVDFLAGLANVGPADEEKPPADFLAGLAQAASDDEGDVPEWLANLRTELPAAAPEPVQAEASSDDLLAGLGENAPEDIPAQAGDQWGFAQGFGGDAPSLTPEQEETPDWLKALKDQSVAQAPAQTDSLFEAQSPTAGFDGAGDLPSWLGELSQDGRGGSSVGDSAQGLTAEFKDDLVAAPPQAADAQPGWLADLTSIPAEQIQPDDLPSWLDEIKEDTSSAKSTPPAVANDTPDWLASIQGSISQLEQAEAVQPAPASDDLPNWLESLPAEIPAQPETPAPVSEEPPASMPGATGLPSWMDSLEPPAGEQPSLPSQEQADLPGWLADSLGKGLAPETATPEQPVTGRGSTKAFDTGTLRELGGERLPDETPGWLAGLGVAAAGTAAGLGNRQPDTVPSSETEEIPSGQAEPAETATQAAGGLEPLAESAPLQPDVLQGDEQNVDSIFSMDMPDWLSGFTPSDLEPSLPSGEAQEVADISPADLPSWVQAMRPVEAVISSSEIENEEQFIEKEGPLAGLRAVLPVQPALLGSRKPKTFSIKLQVDNSQKAQTVILEQLLAVESKPSPVPRRDREGAMRILRWVIAAALLLAALLPSVLGLNLLPAPGAPTDLRDFSQVIESLPGAAPVLVVVDYEPSYSGEMESAVGPVLDHLMLKGVPLVFVTTSPSGSFLAERLRHNQHGQHAYQAGEDYLDLGYLPGGAAGIQVFATNPQQLVGYTLGGNLWQTPLLQEINSFADFSAAVILTDNPYDGRVWIEQTWRFDNPLLVVSSAQAEPMIRPYYDSSQIQGMVTGLAGGVIYENELQRPGLGRLQWDAYGTALIVSLVLLLVGGVWAILSAVMSRRSLKPDTDTDEA
jgi:hypothetical protein